ncbi:MAG: bifunctional YncE family protein/alkaline phosphatase family protein [Acidobacteria bacterium]|nr:bifunctional YncE family protein/alkaline phosphatase family protein [Acidobacteriota bacterium]MBI3658024.1 bifunctional YncE family protein/alkaline phosphatase family protein [Acidobacteriota bacterium]
MRPFIGHRAIVPWLIAAAGLTLVSFAIITTNTVWVGEQPDGSFIVPTGQAITPAGDPIEVNDRPLGMAVSSDGNLLIVVTGSNFAARRIHVIDTEAHSITQSISIGDSFVGVALSPDDQWLYVGGGNDNEVKIFKRNGPATFAADGAVTMPLSNSAPSGLSRSPYGETLYVALNLRQSVGIVNTSTRGVTTVPVGSYPYTTIVTPDGTKVYISNWGGRRPEPGDATDGAIPVVVDPETGIVNNGTVSVLDTESQTVVGSIEVGLHPSAMAMSPYGEKLYVANANSDTISVINTATDQVERTIDVRLFVTAPLGSAPNALAITADGKTLYVANAANNAVAVVDLDRPQDPVIGFIPTGWFPTAVALSLEEQRLFVASGYGFGSVAPLPPGQGRSFANRMGVVSILDVPDQQQLAKYTRQVMRNNRAPAAMERAGATAKRATRPFPAIPQAQGQPSPIKHVFYIIKENRTYDQVFGDLPQGNGDPNLVLFGRNVTPNHHALVEQFVLMDNFYTVGDQSALGHQWCDEAYANDYVHKYGNARNDFAGTNPMAYAPSGFLWDHARQHKKTVRVYGEFGAITTITPSSSTWTDIYTDWRKGTGRIQISARSRVAGLRDIYAPQFPGFHMRIPEQLRVDIFLREFRQFVKDGNLPDLIIMLLPIDHTNGTSPGYPTPRAMLADNDLALGRLVAEISKSRYWRESAIFVTEDDSQAGVDHVDGHRTVGLVISPFAKRKAVDSSLYTTINMFRTIEQILGLPPLNQYDLAAEPMFSVFSDTPDFSPYQALPNQIPLDEMNRTLVGLTGLQKNLAEESIKMNFSGPDEAPEEILNRVIWHSVKGYDIPYPTRRGSLPPPPR